jgi:hypothetical protein
MELLQDGGNVLHRTSITIGRDDDRRRFGYFYATGQAFCLVSGRQARNRKGVQYPSYMADTTNTRNKISSDFVTETGGQANKFKTVKNSIVLLSNSKDISIDPPSDNTTSLGTGKRKWKSVNASEFDAH